MTARKAGTRCRIPLDAPTGPNRYLAAVVLAELGETTFDQLVRAVMPRLPAVGPDKNRRGRAHQSVNALIDRGNISRDGDTVRLVAMPGRPLTPAEIENRKWATAARKAAMMAKQRAVRIPAPEQDDDDITLGVGKFALWSPRSVLATDGGLKYLLWFIGRSVFRERYRDAWCAVAYVLAEHLKYEAQRP